MPIIRNAPTPVTTVRGVGVARLWLHLVVIQSEDSQGQFGKICWFLVVRRQLLISLGLEYTFGGENESNISASSHHNC